MIPVQLIIHTTLTANTITTTELALEGGCKWVRLHFDADFQGEKETFARQMLALCRKYKATFVVDSDVDLCKTIEADGVHLFETDMAANEARERLGHEFIIGTTAHSFEDVKQQKRLSADYVCLGPLHAEEGAIGLQGYAEVIEEMEKEELRMPLCAFGGITQADILPLLKAGVQGIAVSSAITESDAPQATMQAFLNADEEGV